MIKINRRNYKGKGAPRVRGAPFKFIGYTLASVPVPRNCREETLVFDQSNRDFFAVKLIMGH